MSSRTPRARLVFALVVGLGGVAILCALGTWQLQRLAWKEGLIAELEARLAAGGAFAILKVGRRLGRLRAAIEAAGLGEGAVYVGHASLARQVVAPLAEAPEEAPYFSMILVPGRDPHVG